MSGRYGLSMPLWWEEVSVEWKDIIALFLGTVGAVLGVVNFARSILDERVRLRVIPCLAWRRGNGSLTARTSHRLEELWREFGMPAIAVEVINHSKFPISIDEVGLKELHVSPSEGRAPFIYATDMAGRGYPIKLEPREAATIYSKDRHGEEYIFTSDTVAYVTTSCDVTQIGKGKALSAWAEIHKKYIRHVQS